MPEFQGEHLVRPLLSAVCQRFVELSHEHAFLDTSTKRLPAIKLYWHFGFRPHLRDENDACVWSDLEDHLNA